MTLEEWIIKNNKLTLASDIATHIEQFIPDAVDAEMLLRLILISIREMEKGE